tara:strand:- start:1031 stop:1702 length:672 start_codon:yes stop_codon:yes gene_type:complete
MKKLLFIFLLYIPYWGSTQECSKIVLFGDTEICLPNIAGMKESYSNLTVKTYADLLTAPDEIILGYYLNNDDYNKINTTFLSEGLSKDFAKIYSLETIENISVDEEVLDYFVTSMKSAFDDSKWSSLKEKSDVLSMLSEMDIEFGKPIVLEDYEINSKIKSLVLLSKFSIDDKSEVLVSILNLIIIKKRLICLAYYESYTGPDQIENTKSKNDYFALRLLTSN